MPLMFALAAAAAPDAQPVTVEIVTVGHSDLPAARYEANAYVTASAETQAAADVLLATRKKALIDQLAATGAQILPSDRAAPLVTLDMSSGSSPDASEASAKNTARANATVRFSTPDQATMAKAQSIAAKNGNSSISVDPAGVVADPVAARRAAKDDGLEKARTEAKAYAAKLGLPVVTLVAISEKGDLGSLFMMSQDGRASPFAPKQSIDGKVPTDVPMTVTFRLEARR